MGNRNTNMPKLVIGRAACPTPSGYITAREVSEMFGVCKETACNWARKGLYGSRFQENVGPFQGRWIFKKELAEQALKEMSH